jgi:hypothetical protein
MDEHPPPHATVELLVDGEHVVSTRIENIVGDHLEVTAPEPAAGGPYAHRFDLRWTNERGIVTQRVFVEGESVHEPDEAPTWRLSFTGPVDVEQRREYVRVDKADRVLVSAGTETWMGSMVDLSEGGVRCIAPGHQEMEPGDTVNVVLGLGEHRLVLRGTVVRQVDTPDGERAFAVTFSGIEASDADLIRRYVFREQLSQRRRQRGEA